MASKYDTLGKLFVETYKAGSFAEVALAILDGLVAARFQEGYMWMVGGSHTFGVMVMDHLTFGSGIGISWIKQLARCMCPRDVST